ncbi:MAG: nodulation protein NfeD [Armatimonadota bacterium]|nr:nodulation protein NfeD [Armatimonadota bacterium]MDR5702165.1 nodulation protein NfeD [Armatimonadota bacterium]MDR7433947.1 nodulation protein NfeD [Armatimonadota bacterium]
MQRLWLLWAILWVGIFAFAQDSQPVVYLIKVDGVIGPSTAHYISRAIGEADRNGATALVIQLDTPGGLMKSTDDITRAMLASPVPIVVYVSPSGARAGSAGVWITYAANIAAMAPATHIGAASPVGLGGQAPDETLKRKITEDAVANLRALANKRGRNAEWAEKAVREAASITEQEALRLRVVDLIAQDLRDLLRKIDGRAVETASGKVILRTANARVVEISPDVREKFLDLLSDPNVGFVLMTIAIYGIIFELSNPGAIFPGVIGGIALILALASFAILKVNVAGLLLIGFALLLFLLDLFLPSHGILTAGGIASFIFGAILLTERQAPYLQISLQLIIAVALLTAAFFLFAVGAGLRAQRRVIRTGREGLIGATGVARTEINPEGTVFLQGELWSAMSDGEPIPNGARVQVVGVEGLRLRVRRVEEHPPGTAAKPPHS